MRGKILNFLRMIFFIPRLLKKIISRLAGMLMNRYKTSSGWTSPFLPLKNFQNNCYMNSILQCLYSIHNISPILLPNTFGENALLSLVVQNFLQKDETFSVSSLKYAINQKTAAFDDLLQHDALEFYISLISLMGTEQCEKHVSFIGISRGDNPPTNSEEAYTEAAQRLFLRIHPDWARHFYSFQKNQTVCCHCQNVKEHFQHTSFFSLPLPLEKPPSTTILLHIVTANCPFVLRKSCREESSLIQSYAVPCLPYLNFKKGNEELYHQLQRIITNRHSFNENQFAIFVSHGEFKTTKLTRLDQSESIQTNSVLYAYVKTNLLSDLYATSVTIQSRTTTAEYLFLHEAEFDNSVLERKLPSVLDQLLMFPMEIQMNKVEIKEKIQFKKSSKIIELPEHFCREEENPVRRVQNEISIYDCLRLHCAPVLVAEGSEWCCGSCQRIGLCQIRTLIYDLAPVLVLHLRRFQMLETPGRRLAARMEKIDKKINYPKFLHMREFMNQAANHKRSKECTYQLVSVCRHFGSLNGGHYSAFSYYKRDDNWYHCNDRKIEKVTENEVLNDSNAILLFYVRADLLME